MNLPRGRRNFPFASCNISSNYEHTIVICTLGFMARFAGAMEKVCFMISSKTFSFFSPSTTTTTTETMQSSLHSFTFIHHSRLEFEFIPPTCISPFIELLGNCTRENFLAFRTRRRKEVGKEFFFQLILIFLFFCNFILVCSVAIQMRKKNCSMAKWRRKLFAIIYATLKNFAK